MPFGSSAVEYLIVGLGNPGSEYEQTRHNIGFRALDFVSGSCGIEVKRLKHMALTGKGTLAGHGVLLMKPQTYMNASGKAVADAAHFYKIPPERIVIVHDDISLPVGAMRIRLSGSPGGHNGLKSIQECLSSDRYIRIKLGVGGKAHADMDLADHVLGRFSPADFGAISGLFPSVLCALEYITDGKAELAMSRCNRSVPKEQNT